MNGLMDIKRYVSGGQIDTIYQDLFGRQPDAEGKSYWEGVLKDLPLSEAYRLIAGGAQSDDLSKLDRVAEVEKAVTSAYREQLGRNPTEAELGNYVAQLSDGRSIADISREIDRTLEGVNFDTEKIEATYRNIFGRTLDQEGFQYWMGQEDALAGKVDADTFKDYIKGGAQTDDMARLAARPEEGYGVNSPLELAALVADPYGGRMFTELPYYFGDVPSDAVNVSTTQAGEKIQFTSPVTQRPGVSYFDGDNFVFREGENVLQKADVDAAVNRALASGALDQAGANQIYQNYRTAKTWGEVYDILNRPKANVVLNELGVQVGEDKDPAVALAEAEERKILATTASDQIGGMYPSVPLQQQVAAATGAAYPFTPEALAPSGLSTLKTREDVLRNLGTDIRLQDAVITQRPGALLRTPPNYPGLLTDAYRPNIGTEFRTVSGELIRERPAAGLGELIPLESMTRYGLPIGGEAQPARPMQPIAPYLGPSFAPPTNVNQTGLTPPGYVIDPATGRVTFPYSTFTGAPVTTTAPDGSNPSSTIDFPTGGTNTNLRGKDAIIENQNDSGGKAGGLVLYAGGPVMGTPQYFEEGGEVEPMRKYTPTELGSTFDVSEYIDPETGRFMINEYRRDIVFNKGLEGAEAEARARMTPEEKEMAMRDLMIRQGRTGREYGLPGITVGGPATSGIRPLNYYAEGGEAKGLGGIAMRGAAEEIRQQGRNGDTILAHINPQEAKMLEAMGGSGTINPRTGLPEYGFSWKKLFRTVAPVLPFIPIPGLFGMSSLLTKSILSGLLAGASAPKGFSIQRALAGGALSYGLGSLAQNAGITSAPDASAAAAPGGGPSMLVPEGTAINPDALEAAMATPPTGGPQPVDPFSATQTAADVAGLAPSPQIDPYSGTQTFEQANLPRPSNLPISTQPITPTVPTPSSTGLTTDLYTQGPGVGGPLSNLEAIGATVAGVGGASAARQQEKYDAMVALAEKEEEDRKKRGRELFARTLGSVPVYGRSGGLMALAGGGSIDPVGYEGGGMTAPVNQPRMLAGGGDGMSDSIPATIDGTQPARLADGEFVIPADVVADIGNGSSSAGAKRLYGMMDRVREARHGTTKQPPEIKMNRLMPA